MGVPGDLSFVSLNGVREYTSFASAAAELDTSGRLRAVLDRARADRDAAAANIGIAERDVRRLVAISYYRVLLTRRLIAVNRSALDEATSFEARAKLLFQNGEAAQADVIKASAQVAFLQQAIQAAELAAQIANHDLASFWTTDVASPLNLEDVLDAAVNPPEDAQPAAATFLKRPEFFLYDAQKRGFLADSRRARADLLPQTSLIYQYGIDSTRLRIQDRGYATFVRLNIPVFDWLRARSASWQFRIAAQQVETNAQIAQRTFSKAYQDALASVQRIYPQIAITEAQMRLSQDNLNLSRVRYEGSEGSALEVVLAQNQLAQARTNHYTIKANYFLARIDLEVAAGR